MDDFEPLIPPEDPTPSGSPLPDPFAPDPTIFPPPPPWLFPTVMIMLAIATLVVLILIYGWYKSIQVSKAEREALPKKDWVDLSKLGARGRWEEDGDRSTRREPPSDVAEPDDPAAPDDPDGTVTKR